MQSENEKEIRILEDRLALLKKFAEFTDKNGSPYFHMDFLLKNVLKLTPEEIAENKSYYDNGNKTEFEF